MATKLLDKVLEELGLISLWLSPIDTKLLCLQRFVRLFAYGGSTLILVAYLDELGISKAQIGIFMTLTLVGDVFVSFILTLFADALGRKLVLALGAALMAGSGIVFAISGNYWVLLLAAILGVISPSGNEIGPFRAIEESTLAQLTPPASRGDVYCWYSLIGQAGAACGMMTSGWVIHYLLDKKSWEKVKVHRAVFFAYAAFGILKVILALALSKNVEAEDIAVSASTSETGPLLGNATEDDEPKKSTIRSFLPSISAESRVIVLHLCLLFALDAFASGLAPLSWAIFFFQDKFNLEEGRLGSLFFTASCISAVSMLLAASIAKRFGNVKTMVFTHLPSSIFLALIPVPHSLQIAALFLLLRSCTQSMDTAPRSAFIAAVVRKHERTAIMGFFNITKTTAMSLGPTITGILASKKLFWVAFVAAGTLKGVYDFGMLAIFAGHKSIEERDEDERRVEEEERLRESEDPNER